MADLYVENAVRMAYDAAAQYGRGVLAGYGTSVFNRDALARVADE